MRVLLLLTAAAEPRFFAPPQFAPIPHAAAGRHSLSTLSARPAHLLELDEEWKPVASPQHDEGALTMSVLVGGFCGAVGAAACNGRKRPYPRAAEAARHARRSGIAAIEMMGRKGRPTMPSQEFGMGQGQMMRQEPEAPSDGMPVFYLYCRTSPGKPWYPVSALKGDGKAKSLVNAWLDSPIMKGVFKDKVDENVARSIFESERRLASMAVQQYKALERNKTKLEWGYKILDENLMKKVAAGDIEEQNIILVNKGMVKEGLLDQAKNMFGVKG
jgi:hypothetical protein